MDVLKAERLIDGIDDLPTLPFVVSRMLEVVVDSGSVAQDLAQVISMDQSLTAKVLRLVNSSFYGFRGRISTASHAVVMLGFNVIKGLALGLSVVKVMGNMGKSKAFDHEAFWEHSLGCAVCARWLGKQMGYDPPEEAMVAGLLHDIGKILLSEYAAGPFEEAIRIASEEERSLAEAEEQVFDFDHTVVGTLLAKRWNLPVPLRDGIKFHHGAWLGEQSPNSDIVFVVQLSDLYCKEQGIGFGGDRTLPDEYELMCREVGLGKQDRARLFPRLEAEVREAKALFGIGG